MTVCNYDGDFRFVDGGGPLVGKGVSSLTDIYAPASVGFDNNDLGLVEDLPASGTSTGMAVSFWLNMNKDNEFGLSSGIGGDPSVDQELLSLDVGVLSDTAAGWWYVKLGGTDITFGAHGSGVSDIFACGTADSQATGAVVVTDSYLDLLNMGWFHVLASVNITNSPTAADVNYYSFVYVNDTLVWELQEIDMPQSPNSITYLKVANGTTGNGASLGRRGTGSSYAMSEFWLIDEFVDWSVKANRYKFHKYENGLYRPVDIGARGQTPGFGNPHLYMTGGPSAFIKNRAIVGGTATDVGGGLQSTPDIT